MCYQLLGIYYTSLVFIISGGKGDSELGVAVR